MDDLLFTIIYILLIIAMIVCVLAALFGGQDKHKNCRLAMNCRGKFKSRKKSKKKEG